MDKKLIFISANLNSFTSDDKHKLCEFIQINLLDISLLESRTEWWRRKKRKKKNFEIAEEGKTFASSTEKAFQCISTADRRRE